MEPPTRLTYKAKDSFTSFKSAGDTHLSKGQFRDAIKAFTSALEIVGDSKSSLLSRSQAYIHLGDIEKAINDAEATLKDDPTFWKGVYQKAEALYASGEFELALIQYHRGFYIRQIDAFRLGIQKAEAAILECFERDFDEAEEQKLVPPIQGRIDLTTGRMLADQIAKMDLPERGSTPDFAGIDRQPSLSELGPSANQLGTPRHSLLTAEIEDESKPQLPILKLNNKSKKRNKRLLGELSTDRQFLEDLMNDPMMTKRDVSSYNQRKSREVKHLKNIIGNGLSYLDNRAQFWREQHPPTAAKKEEKPPSPRSSLLTPYYSPRTSAYTSPYTRNPKTTRGDSTLSRLVPEPMTANTPLTSRVQTKGESETEMRILVDCLQDSFNMSSFNSCIQDSKDVLSKLNRQRSLPNRDSLVCEVYNLIGMSYVSLELYQVATTHFETCLRVATRGKLYDWRITSMIQLGSLFQTSKRYNLALRVYNELLSYSNSLPVEQYEEHKISVIESVYNLAVCYLSVQNYDQAIITCEQLLTKVGLPTTITIIQELPLDYYGLLLRLFTVMTEAYFYLEDTQSALECSEKWMEISKVDVVNYVVPDSLYDYLDWENVVKALEMHGSIKLKLQKVDESLKIHAFVNELTRGVKTNNEDVLPDE
ncbi:hypothetical protein PCE1_000212 [Barthelona sp. PCE]